MLYNRDISIDTMHLSDFIPILSFDMINMSTPFITLMFIVVYLFPRMQWSDLDHHIYISVYIYIDIIQFSFGSLIMLYICTPTFIYIYIFFYFAEEACNCGERPCPSRRNAIIVDDERSDGFYNR